MDFQNSSQDSPTTEPTQPGKRKRGTEPEPDPELESQCEPKSDTQATHPLYKTSLCSYFRRSQGECSHGPTCRFAHGESELRIRPYGTWDPTSERAKKVAKTDKDDDEVAEKDVMMTEAVEMNDDVSVCDGMSKCFVNLPMKWSSDQFRKFLSDKGIQLKSAKKKKGMIVGFVTFETMDQANIAVKELDGVSVGNNRTLKIADVIPRSFDINNKLLLPPHSAKKIDKPSEGCSNTDATESADEDGNSISEGSVLKGRSARDVVTPLAHMSYPDQLEHKKNALAQTLKKLTRNARKACPNGISLPEWILKSREIGGLPCKLEGIIESPLINGYRNKCEFSVGYSLQGIPTVGFLLGNFREGVTAVEGPLDCPNVSRIACKYATVFQEFLQQSQLPLWNRLNNSGFWRQLTVREGRGNCKMPEDSNSGMDISEVMLIVQVCTLGFDDQQVRSELESLAQMFYVGSTTESPPIPLTELVIQDHTGISNAAPYDAPFRYVFSHKEGSDRGLEIATDTVEPRIHDYISNLRFSLSPSAFFQVNTLAAEKLYALAGDWAGLGPDTLLFDICCGTGTIGLTLANRVGMVVGIEMNASAVSDAQRNADINGIKNCTFVCGKAEDVIGSLMKKYITMPTKPDGISNASEISSAAEENIETADSVRGTEDVSSVEHETSRSLSSEKETQPVEHGTSEKMTTGPAQQFKNVVAIVDPPRVGLHPTVIKVLRTQSHLRRLVYISCNPESLVANAIELCTPSPEKTTEKGNNKNNRGWRNMSSAGLARHRAKSMPESEPFKPLKAMAVDLFPHTPHCELVMLLER